MTSLVFVIAAMLEFAGIMLIQRKNRLITRNEVTASGNSARRGSFQIEELTEKIDMIALTLHAMSYILFNVKYWEIYLRFL